MSKEAEIPANVAVQSGFRHLRGGDRAVLRRFQQFFDFLLGVHASHLTVDIHTLNCLKIMCVCHGRYKALSCSCPRIRFFRLPYLAYNRSFSSNSLEYSSRKYFSLSRDFLYHLSNFCKKDIWKNQLAANAFWISFSNDSENLSSSSFVLFFGPFRCALLELLRAFLFRCRSISIRSMLSFVYHFPD